MLVFKGVFDIAVFSLPSPDRSLSIKWFELNMKNSNPYSGKASVCITSSSNEKEHYSDFSSDVDH